MNKLLIIGNLTRDPEMRTTTAGKDVCTFTVAVNRRKTGNGKDQEADFFRVSAWEGLVKSCGQFLTKGRKVAVVGSVSLHNYQTQTGENRSQMEVSASDVEFLSPKGDGFTAVDEPDDPFMGGH